MKLGGLLWMLEAMCTIGHTAYWATYKALSFERGPRQERVLQHVQVVIKLPCHLGLKIQHIHFQWSGNVHGRQRCFIDFSGFLQQNDILRFRS